MSSAARGAAATAGQIYEESARQRAGWHERNYSETTGREIDQAVKALVDAAYNRTLAILKSRRHVLEHGARLLLEKETLVEEDVRALMAEDGPAAAQ